MVEGGVSPFTEWGPKSPATWNSGELDQSGLSGNICTSGFKIGRLNPTGCWMGEFVSAIFKVNYLGMLRNVAVR